MLVSVIIPAFEAQPTLERTLASVIAQSLPDWEAIIVADDLFDYAPFLAARGLTDPRIRLATTGGRRTGCHAARNAGLAVAVGDVIAALDADDTMEVACLARLAPIAMAKGAAADNVAVVLDATGAELYRAFGPVSGAFALTLERLFAISTPLFPLVRRSESEPRLAGVEFAEDVVANARLIDRIGPLTVVPDALYHYHVVEGSMAHGADSGLRFDQAYASYVARCRSGDGLGLSDLGRAEAIVGFQHKRALNRLFRRALRHDPGLNFQTFVSRRQQPPAVVDPIAIDRATVTALANPPI